MMASARGFALTLSSNALTLLPAVEMAGFANREYGQRVSTDPKFAGFSPAGQTSVV
jgi:hypothetical protein